MPEMKFTDLVSIITPAYNSSAFIADAIESVLAQTYSNWEMHIVDDNSSDNTGEIVKAYKDSRIHFYRNEINEGASVSRNRALEAAKGRWIAFLDSDDWWAPDKLEKQIAFMLYNNYTFSYTEYVITDSSLQPVGIRVSGPKCITRKRMYDFCWPACVTVMYDQTVMGVQRIPCLRKNNDYAIWLSAVRFSNCYLCPYVLAKYRKRPDSISRVSKRTLIYHHYLLYKLGENRNTAESVALTARNIFWGVYKKIKYYNKER